MKHALSSLLLALTAISTPAPAAPAAPGADPLTVRIQTEDAQRFAALFKAGRLDAAALQQGYLQGAGRGVVVFTPHRIENAENLARSVYERSADYAHAIATCLPLAESLRPELRAIYLAFQGLLPEARLPAVHWVFGAANSGGTAAPDVQVIGLEVACAKGTTPEAFRANMRRLFAHETVHSLQPVRSQEPADLLLWAAFMEGVPDFMARMVTGLEPSPERAAYARGREAEIWRRFQADRALVLAGTEPARGQALARWFGNVGSTPAGAPEGWPSEMGYWLGMQITQALFERRLAEGGDARATLRQLIAAEDPAALLAASGYRGGPAP